MHKKTRLLLYFLLAGLFLLVDRFLKWQAVHGWSKPESWLFWTGWEPYFNSGLAFGLPLPNWLIASLSLPVIILIAYLFFASISLEAVYKQLALLLILTGAVSNFFDRLAYRQTIDYLRLFTGVVNLADALIVVGFVVYLINQEIKKSRKQEQVNPENKESIKQL